MVLSSTTDQSLITRKQAAAILGCTDRFLDDHAQELGKQGEGRAVRYSKEQVLKIRDERNIAGPMQSHDFQRPPQDYMRMNYFSTRELADQLNRQIANIPLRFYAMAGVFRDQEGAWLFPKKETERQIDILRNGDLSSRRGLRRFLGISKATLQDAESRGELTKNSLGVKGMVEYSAEQALKFVAEHYPARYADYFESLNKQREIPKELSEKLSSLAVLTLAMFEGRTHFKTVEMGAVLGLSNPYSLKVDERAALGAVSIGRDVYYPKYLVCAEWFKNQIEKRTEIAVNQGESIAGWQTIGAILVQSHLKFLDSKDAVMVERECRDALRHAQTSQQCERPDLLMWSNAIRTLIERRSKPEEQVSLLNASLLVQKIAIEARLKSWLS